MAAPHHRPPAGHLAGGSVYSPSQLRSRGGESIRPGLHCPGRGAVVGSDRGLHGAGRDHPIRSPRQPATGGGSGHWGEFACPVAVVGSRPRDSNRLSRHPALGLPSILCRHRPDRCRSQPSGAACAPPAAGWKRGIAPPPQTNSLAGGGAVSLSGSVFLRYTQNTPLALARYFLAGYLLLACRF